MIFDVDIRDGYYGRIKTLANGKEVFKPYGKEVALNSVLERIDGDGVKFELLYQYRSKQKWMVIPRGNLCDTKYCEKMGDKGVDVTKQSFSCLADSIFAQEDTCFEEKRTGFCHDKLGWISTSILDEGNNIQTLYRHTVLKTPAGDVDSLYDGKFKIAPTGSLEKWLEMVNEHVLPHTPMSLVLLCAMSAVPCGLLATKYPIANGVLHLCSASSSGKTTSMFLAVSTAGEPFSSVKKELDKYGNLVEKSSLLQSFSATDNALIENLTGNSGIPIVIDELGKCKSDDLTSVIFSLADGNGKSRLSKELALKESVGFQGTVITAGEFSIFEKCKKKLEGLHNRVFELNDKLTISGEQSEEIKKCCSENNGHIAPLLAQHILDKGGADYLSNKYDFWSKTLTDSFPDAPNKKRFIETFAALYLVTAEIAKDAFDLDFNISAIIAYFANYLAGGKTQDVSLSSYTELLNEFFSHSGNFYSQKDSNEISSTVEVWGRYVSHSGKYTTDGKLIVGEFLVREHIVERLLKEKGYTKKQCIDVWKRENLINYEKDRSTRCRKIDLSKDAENVYAFYVFAAEEDTNA